MREVCKGCGYIITKLGMEEHDDDCAVGLRSVIAELENRVKELEAAQRWIPVTERLPDNLEAVLVYGESDNPTRKGFDVTWRADTLSMSWFIKNITHWQPLPPAPAADRGEQP